MSPTQERIIEKVRRAGCLSHAELQSLEALSENWEARLRINQLDRLWGEEVPRHLIQIRINGISTYRLPSSGGSKMTLGIGVFCIIYGLSGIIPVMPLGLFMVGIGVFAIYRSKGQKQGWQAYEDARSSYDNERHAALQQLPPEYHPATRVCRHCVKPIV